METITLRNKGKAELAVSVIRAVADTIKDAGRIPAGTLYAGLMAQGCTMQQYEQIEGILILSGVIRKNNDELIWNIA